jgi:hypothetical protein
MPIYPSDVVEQAIRDLATTGTTRLAPDFETKPQPFLLSRIGKSAKVHGWETGGSDEVLFKARIKFEPRLPAIRGLATRLGKDFGYRGHIETDEHAIRPDGSYNS